MATPLSNAFAIFPAIAFGLGTWQVYRWDRKKKMISYREQRRDAAPVEYVGGALDVDDMEFRKIHVRGTFDHTRDLTVGPRSMEGESGFFVLTPLELSSGQGSLLVNRGWVPREDRHQYALPSGEQELVGVVRQGEIQSRFVPDNNLENSEVYFMDNVQLGAHLKCQGGFRLDQIRGNNTSVPPIGGTTVYSMPNNHVNYIFTWYGLAAALVGIMSMSRRGKIR